MMDLGSETGGLLGKCRSVRMANKEIVEELVASKKEEGKMVDKFVGTVALLGQTERDTMLGYHGELVPKEVGPGRWMCEVEETRIEEDVK